jgi:Uncharacterized protein conserved in bacteria (DUF2066)
MTTIARKTRSGRERARRPMAPLLGLVLLSVATAGARAASTDLVFTVGNYPVEARAENAVAAKHRALADGQQAAFRSLLKRLVPVTAYARIHDLSAIKAGDLVDGYRVRSERNSATEYIASLDFSFHPKSIRDMLRREGIAFTDEQAPPLILVPVRRAGSGAPGNDPAWTKVWKGLDLDHALTPVKLQTLKKEVAAETVNALAAGDGRAMRGLAAAYRSELVLVAVAEQDTAARRLNVTLSGQDAVGAFTLKRAYRLDAIDPTYTTELAAVVSLRILEGRWKALKSRHDASAARDAVDLLIAVEFRGMSEWQDISRRLGSTPGVEEFEVAGLSARGARVTLRYAEGAQGLANVLARQGLSLRAVGSSWVLSLQ